MRKNLIIVFIYVAVLLSGCVTFTDKGYMYDRDDLIVEEGDSFTYRSKVGTYEDLDFQDFSGTETVLSVEDIDVLYVTIDFSLEKGQFKIVWINHLNEITILEKGSHEFVLYGEVARIKIVGSHAYGNVKINTES